MQKKNTCGVAVGGGGGGGGRKQGPALGVVETMAKHRVGKVQRTEGRSARDGQLP